MRLNVERSVVGPSVEFLIQLRRRRQESNARISRYIDESLSLW